MRSTRQPIPVDGTPTQPKPIEILDTEMLIITSLGFNRIERQQKCVKSWLDRGAKVTAVQSAGEEELLKDNFPDIRIVETNLVGDKFGRPKHVRISALLKEITCKQALILNSDIEIITTRSDFVREWNVDLPAGVMKMGIRWDFCPTTGRCQLLKYGIDAFLVTKKAASLLPDLGLTIGCPAWDYWLPYHLHLLKYEIETCKRKEFIHEVHEQNWNKKDYETGLVITTEPYSHLGLTRHTLAEFIQKITERRNLPKARL